MKRYISILLIISYSIFILTPAMIYSQVSKIKIIKIIGDKFAINQGTQDGIKENTYYIIIQDGKSIGKAKVIAVREKISALQIINLNRECSLNIGDELIYDSSEESQSEDLLMQIETNSFSKDKLASPTNYYFEGQKSAKNEYGGGGAMVGGLVAGTLLGLIGWGLGYAIMSGSDIDVPSHHLSNLNSQQQFDFSSGYKETAKKKRNRNFHAGAAIGTLIAVVIVLSVTNSNQ